MSRSMRASGASVPEASVGLVESTLAESLAGGRMPVSGYSEEVLDRHLCQCILQFGNCRVARALSVRGLARAAEEGWVRSLRVLMRTVHWSEEQRREAMVAAAERLKGECLDVLLCNCNSIPSCAFSALCAPLHQVNDGERVNALSAVLHHPSRSDALTSLADKVELVLAASVANSPDVLRFLSKYGVDARVVDARGRGPLHHAALYGVFFPSQKTHPRWEETIALLTSLGVNVNAQDAEGCTMLHYL